MRVVSWNVNGIRAVDRKNKFFPIITELNPSILILQETKAEASQVPVHVREIPGYTAFFNASQDRPGYSGTALYTREPPRLVTKGIGNDAFDTEGRVITAFYPEIAVSNIYFPNGGRGPDRLQFKLAFYDAFLEYVETLRSTHAVIWGGDVNTAHEQIDLARPKENEHSTGFLPEERAWLDQVVDLGWVDTFRSCNPEKIGAYTYWDMKTHARERNVGWRIDYLFISPDMMHRLQSATIHEDFYGSDHCPISVDLRG